jgi:hypothetical protein
LRRHALAHLGREPDALENVRHAAIDLAARERALRRERQRHDVLDAPARIERGERVLEHRLDQARTFFPVEPEQALAVDQRGARGWRKQSEDQPRQRGFPAARLADDAEHAAGRYAEGDIVDRDDMFLRRQHAGAHAEFAPQVSHFDPDAHAGCGSASWGASRQR